MFVQVMIGRASDPQALRMALDRWALDLADEAPGWLGSTAGVAEDGTAFCLARFASTEAAQRNSDRPEQTAWWNEFHPLLSDITVEDYPDAREFLGGGSDLAGFVQVIRGRAADARRMREIGDELEGLMIRRPDMIGGLEAMQADGSFTTLIYFTCEADARTGEQMEAPPEVRRLLDEQWSLMQDVSYLDLREPMLASPATKAAAIVRSGYDAFARGDIAGALSIMAEDVTWSIQSTIPTLGGTVTGRDQVGAFFSTLSQTWAALQVRPEQVLQDGERVVVLGQHVGRTHGGTDYTMPFAHVWTVRGGLVTSFVEHTDSGRAMQLLSEQAPNQVPTQAPAAERPSSASSSAG